MIFNEPIPKKYRKVKTATLKLSDENCVEAEREVAVCMHSAGTPTFCVYVPPPYSDAWVNHRSKDPFEFERDRTFVAGEDGWVHAESFDAATKRLAMMSTNYKRFMATRTMEKVIALQLNLHVKGSFTVGELPSFSRPEAMAGIWAAVRYRVGGVLYQDGRRFPGDEETQLDTEPQFSDLDKTDGYKLTIIPYSDAAWATVLSVRETLKRAAIMLRELKGENAQALLESGMQALMLAAPGGES